MVSLTVDVSGLVDGPTSYIDAADVSTPIGQLKTHLENTLNGVQQFDQLTFAAEGAALGIVSDAITITRTAHKIDTEALGATDNLSTINGGATGDVLLLRINSAARTVVIKHNVGNIRTGNLADITLDQTSDVALLVYDGSVWNVVSPNNATGVIDVYEQGSAVASGATRVNFADSGHDVEYSAPSANVWTFAPSVAEGRLSLTTGTPVTTSDVTSTPFCYYVPYVGNRLALYDGTRWRIVTFTDLFLVLDQTQTGTTTNGNNTVTGLTDTSQIAVGMEVSGTFIPGGTTVAAILSATSVQLSANASGGASVSLTFQVPANRNVDIFAYWTGTVAALEMRLWTNDTTRATALTTLQNVYVLTGATTRRYVGTIRTNGTAGRVEDTLLKRFVWNVQNQVQRKMQVRESTASWTYSSATWRSLNSSNNNRVEFVRGLNDKLVRFEGRAQVTWTTGGGGQSEGNIGVGLDVTNANSADLVEAAAFSTANAGSFAGLAAALYEQFPAVGYHFLQLVESVGVYLGYTSAMTYSGGSLRTGGAGWIWG